MFFFVEWLILRKLRLLESHTILDCTVADLSSGIIFCDWLPSCWKWSLLADLHPRTTMTSRRVELNSSVQSWGL